MWLSFYNPKAVGDILMLMSADIDQKSLGIETLSDVTRLYNKKTNETVGYNIHRISHYMGIEGCGHVILTADQVDQLNQLLYEQGFETIQYESKPRIVVGKVLACEEHPDSDHLHVTKVELGEEGVQQIVCGAKNIEAGLTVVVALPGAVMPNGQVICSGTLRGVESYGMICSAYELGLDPEHEKIGIMSLSDDISAGTPFDKIKGLL